MENNIDAEQQFAADCADGGAMRFAFGAFFVAAGFQYFIWQ